MKLVTACPFFEQKEGDVDGILDNTMTKKFIAYSETAGIATSAKTFDSLEELRDLMRWYLAHEWETDRTWPENIAKYGGG